MWRTYTELEGDETARLMRVEVIVHLQEHAREVVLLEVPPACLRPRRPLREPAPPGAPWPERGELARWRQRHWFDHQRLSPDRLEVVAAELPPGTYRYSYEARIVATGDFHAPPVQVLSTSGAWGASAPARVVIHR